jgi:hypothetical protein
MKIILENSESRLDADIVEDVNEANGVRTKNYYIEGVFSTIGEKNRNGRVYSKAIWESQVYDFQKNFDDRTSYNLLGEYQHPPRAEVDPMLGVIKIEKLWIDENYVKGRAKILNNNSEKTNQLKALIDEGFQIGVSSRGVGKVGVSGVIENFKLVTYDVVDKPSDYNAMMNGVTEGVLINEGIVQDKDFKIGVNGELVEIQICDEETCYMNTLTEDELKKAQKAILDSFDGMFKTL